VKHTARMALWGALLLFALPGPARAVSILDFSGLIPGSGSLEYTAVGGPLVAAAIEFTSLTSVQSPAHSGDTEACVDCTLAFETGALISYTPASSGVPHETWLFEGGAASSIQLSGKVPSIGISSSSALLTAIFSEDVTVDRYPSIGFAVNIGIHEGVVNAALASYFGELTNVAEEGAIALTFLVPSVNPNHTFSNSNILSGNLTAHIPEPTTALLLIMGLAGLAWAGKSFPRIPAESAHVRERS